MIFSTGFTTFHILWVAFNIIMTVKGDVGLGFYEEPATVMVNPKDEKTTFTCSANPPMAKIEWFQNGQKIMEDADGMFRIKPPKLIIKLPQSEEYGPTKRSQQQNHHQSSNSNRLVYGGGSLYLQCLARYKGQAVISHPANLIVAKLSPFSNKSDSHLTVIRGNTALIECRPPYSVPNAVTEFYYNETLIDRTKGRYWLEPSGNLQILNAQPKDSGIYHCIAHNPLLKEKEPAKHRIHLTVKEDRILQAAKIWENLPETTTAVKYTNITLECAAHGYPIPNITWHKKGGKLPHGRHSQRAGNLLLYSVLRGDEGHYVCKADNGIGKHAITHTTLEVQEPPTIVSHSHNKRVIEGEHVTLECIAKGEPKPEVMWYHNGNIVHEHSRNTIKETRLIIQQAKHHHSGIYQCSASNELGAAYASTHLTVMSSEKTINSTMTDAKHHSNSHHHHKNKSEVFINRKTKKKVKTVPPSRPEVNRLSDDSVMVSWEVPRNDGLSILFFKIQYREVGKKHADSWITVDKDIEPHIFSYSITGLKKGAKYRFRIAAVYSNNDNKTGPKSAKFTLQRESPMQKPIYKPVIKEAEAISPSAIRLAWRYPDKVTVPIEGFFVYYRTTHTVGEYTKMHVQGSNTRSDIISYLLPDTAYDVKMQGYNEAGISDFSNIYTVKTQKSEASLDLESQTTIVSSGHKNFYAVGGSSTAIGTNRILYIVLGIALGVMLVVLVIFLVLYNRKKKQKRTRRRVSPSAVVGCDLNSIPRMAVNGHNTEGNGYLPRTKINISVNPLSEVERVINGDGIYPLVLQYQEVPSNNNEVILLSTLERNRRHGENDINHSEECNGLISHNNQQAKQDIAESAA